MEKTANTVNAFFYALASSFTVFWILNIAKESSAGVKDFFNAMYPPVGPLLSLYIYSTVLLGILFFVYRTLLRHADPEKHMIRARRLFFASIIVSYLMVFPPLFKLFI